MTSGQVRNKDRLRILAVADVVEPQLYNAHVKEWIGAVDLIISCGDLPPGYLDFLAGILDVPLMHVLGNHCDAKHDQSNRCSPSAYPGAHDLNGKVTAFRKVGCEDDASCAPLLVAGVEGSPIYTGGPHQHSEGEVAATLLGMAPGLMLNKARYGRYLDLFVTHAPPRGIHDDKDVAHKGFKSFIPFIERFKPPLMLHGHTHRYQPLMPMRTHYAHTEVINTYGHVLLELEWKEDGWLLVVGKEH